MWIKEVSTFSSTSPLSHRIQENNPTDFFFQWWLEFSTLEVRRRVAPQGTTCLGAKAATYLLPLLLTFSQGRFLPATRRSQTPAQICLAWQEAAASPSLPPSKPSCPGSLAASSRRSFAHHTPPALTTQESWLGPQWKLWVAKRNKTTALALSAGNGGGFCCQDSLPPPFFFISLPRKRDLCPPGS